MDKNPITISTDQGKIEAIVQLPGSKSESNRALILNALAPQKSNLLNLSQANDTLLMQKLINSKAEILDTEDAGTTMRFLTAYYSISAENKILTGTSRMQARPINILVDALRKLGANIEYIKTEGFPPINIKNFIYSKNNKLKIDSSISSQYASALLMIAPCLPEGLELELTENTASKPYILMTLNMMTDFGISYAWKDNAICIVPQQYKAVTYAVEPDWSSASYWYSIAALSNEANILLKGLKKNSIQGDKAIVEIMDRLGVHTDFVEEGVKLSKKHQEPSIHCDFNDYPDLVQTIFVICAAKNIALSATGIESLRIKETDRIAAMQQELQKIGYQLAESSGTWLLTKQKEVQISNQVFETYNDHRMAMAFALLATQGKITILKPDVVKKSYPDFWKDLKKNGFLLESSINL